MVTGQALIVQGDTLHLPLPDASVVPSDLLEWVVKRPRDAANTRGHGRRPLGGASMAKRTCTYPGCDNPHKAWGWCNKHVKRWRTHGDPSVVAVGNKPGLRRQPLEPRFWAKVNKNGPSPEFRPDLGPCWLWTGWLDPKGYAKFNVDGKNRTAQSVAYELTHGPIPAGLVTDHLCRVPTCVRPSHLEAVTSAENIRRGLNGVLLTHCPRGHLYDEANTYVDPKGHRRCRRCNNENTRRSVRRQRGWR